MPVGRSAPNDAESGEDVATRPGPVTIGGQRRPPRQMCRHGLEHESGQHQRGEHDQNAQRIQAAGHGNHSVQGLACQLVYRIVQVRMGSRRAMPGQCGVCRLVVRRTGAAMPGDTMQDRQARHHRDQDRDEPESTMATAAARSGRHGSQASTIFHTLTGYVI